MNILALDPGPKETGFVVWVDGKIEKSGVELNEQILHALAAVRPDVTVAIEMIASYGMPVGQEVFDTCVWVGRFKQATANPEAVQFVYRKDVKMHICGTMRAKDANVRQALLDKLGPQGVKKSPGPTYGVKSHAWAALAVAVTVAGV